VSGQQSIFGDAPEEPTESGKEWDESELLKHEKEALGFYITGHPLTKYSRQLEMIHTKKTSELEEIPDGEEVQIGGILRNIKKIYTKSKAEIMAYCTLEDADGSIEVIIFPQLYRNNLHLLQKDTLLLIKGTMDKTEKGIKIVSTEISRLDEPENNYRVEINLRYPLSESINLRMIKSILSNSKGDYSLYLRIFLKDAVTLIATGIKISPDSETVHKIEEIAGKGAVTFS